MSRESCPKCGIVSGEDWRQCEGPCPMPMSPHYRPALIVPPKLSPEEARARIAKLLEILPAANPQRFTEMEDIARETLGWLEAGQMPNLNEIAELCRWVLGLRELAEARGGP